MAAVHPQGMSNLASFLFTAQDRDGSGRPVPLFGVAERGQALLADKGCAACHVVVDNRAAGPSYPGSPGGRRRTSSPQDPSQTRLATPAG